MLFSHLIASALCLWGVQGQPVQEENLLSKRALPPNFGKHAAEAITKYAIGGAKTSACPLQLTMLRWHLG
jgi:hypothetical protein